MPRRSSYRRLLVALGDVADPDRDAVDRLHEGLCVVLLEARKRAAEGVDRDVELAPGFAFPVLLNSSTLSAQLVVPLSDDVLRVSRAVAGEAGDEHRIAVHETVRMIEEKGGKAVAVVCDAGVEADVADLVAVHRRGLGVELHATPRVAAAFGGFGERGAIGKMRAAGYARRHKLPSDEFLRRIAPRMTANERLRLLGTAAREGVKEVALTSAAPRSPRSILISPPLMPSKPNSAPAMPNGSNCN